MAYLAGIGEKLQRIDLRTAAGRVTLVIDGVERVIDVREIGNGSYSLLIDGRSWVADAEVKDDTCTLSIRSNPLLLRILDERRQFPSRRAGARDAGRSSEIHAMMPGKVVDVFVKAGEHVKAGHTLLVIEAMKMENEIKALGDGVVKAVPVEPGQTVKLGDLLAVVE